MTDPVYLAQLEQQHGLPAGLLMAQMQAESGGNPNAVSPKGALGAFQFMPKTAAAYGIDPLDPVQAAQGAARMNADLLKQNNGDLPSALAAYNWGSGNLAKNGIENAPQETKDYINKILPQVAPSITAEQAQAELDRRTQAAAPSMPSAEEAQAELTRRGVKAEEPTYTADPVRTAYQATMNTVAKPINNAVNSVIGGAVDLAGKAIDPKAKQLLDQAADYVKNSPVGVAVGEGVQQVKDEVNDLSKYDPNLKADLAAFGENANLAANLPILKPAASIAGNVLEKTGGIIGKSGQVASDAKKADFVQKLVLPKETPTVAADNATRTTAGKGILGKNVYNPTTQEQQIAQTVNTLPVSASNTVQKNLNIIQDAATDEAKNLKTLVQQNDVNFPRKEFGAKLDAITQSLPNHPLLIGDEKAIQTSQMLVNQFNKIFAQQKGSASGLLEARKQFDKFIQNWKTGAAFDPVRENALTIANREIRTAANDFIAQKVPVAGVKQSLKTQSNLLSAAENIAPKAGAEGKTAVARTMQKASNLVGTKAGLAKLAVAGGAATYAPVAAGSALALYGAGKALASPALRKGVGGSIKAVGKALK